MERIKRKEILISIIFVIIITIGIFFTKNFSSNKKINVDTLENNPKTTLETTAEEPELKEVFKDLPKEIVVDICGAIKNPDVIVLKEGDRLIDAVNLAGGLTDKADVNKINLARKLSDGEKIIIPEIGEELTELNPYINSDHSQSNDGKININNATLSQLKELNGIGEVLGTRIIEYRKNNGGFKNIEEIKNVSGIGDKKFEAIKNEIKTK